MLEIGKVDVWKTFVNFPHIWGKTGNGEWQRRKIAYNFVTIGSI